MSSSSQTSLHDKAPMAGTFFNQVPDDDDDKSGDNKEELTDQFNQLEEMIKQRKKPPLASQPSTINGVPTKKASGQGFGAAKNMPPVKKIVAKSSSKPFVGVGPSLNDVTKPEYDDQGYTLYADEKTGEKSRVFEALVDYPCDFTMKIVGDGSDGTFVVDILSIVAESCEVTTGPDSIKHSVRNKGKWTSVTVKAPVQNAEMLYSLYESVDRDPRVKFKF